MLNDESKKKYVLSYFCLPLTERDYVHSITFCGCYDVPYDASNDYIKKILNTICETNNWKDSIGRILVEKIEYKNASEWRKHFADDIISAICGGKLDAGISAFHWLTKYGFYMTLLDTPYKEDYRFSIQQVRTIDA